MSPKRRKTTTGEYHDHTPIELEKFNGLWDQGDPDNTPPDHFVDCNNIQFVGFNSFATRYGIDPFQGVVGPLGNIVRIYNFVTQSLNTLIVLTYDGTTGNIYHVVDSSTVYGPLLTIAGMSDFGFVPYAGRAYITPFTSTVIGGLNVEKGLQSQFLYVYKGDGTAARKAAGDTPAGTLVVANGAAGNQDGGQKVFAVVGETDTGFLSAPCAFAAFVTSDGVSLNFSSIPTFTGTQWVKRHIVSTIAITDYNGNLTGYQFFFIPGADINDNTTTTLSNVGYFDADLLDDATHLLDNFADIPAGVGLCLYHNRLVLYTTYTDISIAYVSAVGEPEAISQVDGILVLTPDGNPITNAQEMRDVLYVTKRNRTVAFIDNGDVPSTWSENVVDLALGAPVHGIATVIDSGSTSTDFLMIATYRGIYLFNGRFIDPELSYKIRGFWLREDRNEFRKIQILNDSINKIIYCILPDGDLLIGDYNNGRDYKNIRWAPWSFTISANTIALVNINTLIIGSNNT